MTWGPDGNLYVTNNGGIDEFNGSTGAFIKTVVANGTAGLETPEFIAFASTVPEPGSLSLILLALAASCHLRQRRVAP